MINDSIESNYVIHVKEAAKRKYNDRAYDMYQYHKGRLHSYGIMLDYDFEKMEADIETVAREIIECSV